MDMGNAKCHALLELLQSRQAITAVNIHRMFGWGNSRILRLFAVMLDAGLIKADPSRPGQFLVQEGPVALGLPPSVMERVGDVLGNGEFLPVGSAGNE